MKRDKIFMWAAISILAIAVIVLVVLLAMKNKKNGGGKNGNGGGKNGQCPSKNAQVGWGSDLYYKPSEPEVLDLAKLPQAILDGDVGKEYVLTNKPAWFPNGIKVYKDILLDQISNEEINKANPDGINEEDLSGLMIKAQALKKNPSTPVTDEDKARIQHYLELIEQFLVDNPDAAKEWDEVVQNLKYLWNRGQGPPPPPVEKPSMGSIYKWAKYIISKLGGVGKLLRMFERRIKYDFINDVVSSYRTQTSGEIAGSGHCTAYPLSWWQNCPTGSTAVGHRGWAKKGSACNKWYQHLSGELLCQKYDGAAQYKSPVGGGCQTVLKVLSTGEKLYKNPEVHTIVAKLLAMALSAASMIPHVGAIISVVATIIKLALPLLGDFSWLLADFKDVCYNFGCEGNTYGKDGQVCGGNSTYCYPAQPDDGVLAARDCPEDLGCLTEPSGKCMNTAPNAAMAMMINPSAGCPGIIPGAPPGYQYWSQ